MIGRVLSHYEIKRQLGQGGMGAVYLAEDRRLHRLVALKFLAPSLIASPEAKARFEREARAVSGLNHPNIGVLYSIEELEEHTFLVLEYLSGGTLQQMLASLRSVDRGLPLASAIRWTSEMSAALGHAHRKGIIHRDVKPGNVMFDEEGRVKLTDFGLAKLGEGADVTGTGETLGTPAYMSPEQALGCGAVDCRSDIFSLGVVIYEMVAGVRPFQAGTQIGVLHQILHEAPAPPRQVRPDLPPALEQVIRRCLEKKPDDRYQSMEELSADLGVSGDDGSAASFHTATISIGGRGAVMSSHSPEFGKWRRHGLALLALAVLAICAGLLFTPLGRMILPGPVSAEQRKLAVLLFDNVGDDPGQQAFCDGLTYSLTGSITQLGRFNDSLWVVPASEVHRESVYSVRDARGAFGVNLALTGSVRRSAENVNVTVNLVDAVDARQLASRTLDAPLAELPTLENRLVEAVGRMLELEITDQVLSGGGATQVASAYEHYLQGQGYLQRFDKPGNLDRAVEAFDAALKADTGYGLARAGLGQAYLAKHTESYETQWLARAQVESQRAIAIDDTLAPAHVNLASLFVRTGRHDEAVEAGRRAVDLDPLNPEAYRALADAYSAAGRDFDAEATYRQAIDLLPEAWLPYSQLGVFYLNRNRFEEAESAFRKVTELATDNESGYRNLGAVYQLTGRYEEAEAMLEKAVGVRATGDNLSNLGTLYFSLGRFKEAAKAYERAVVLSPSAAIIWGNLADAYAAVPQLAAKAPETYRHAIKVAERQLAITRKDPGLLLGLAVYSAKVGDSPEALEYLGAARELMGANAQVNYQAAIVYELSGDRRQALSLLKDAVAAGFPVEAAMRDPQLSQLTADPDFRSLAAE